MQIIKKNNTQVESKLDSVNLSTTSDYIRVFTVPCRASCSFNFSGKINNHDFSIAGSITCGWNSVGLTATLTQYDSGTEGVYAIRAFQSSAGADVNFFLVFSGDVSGLLNLDTTLTSANMEGSTTLVNLVANSTTPSGSQKASIEFWIADKNNLWGTSTSII